MPPTISHVGPFEVRYYPRPLYLPPNSFTSGGHYLSRGAEPIGGCSSPEDLPHIPSEVGLSRLHPHRDQRGVAASTSSPAYSAPCPQRTGHLSHLRSPSPSFKLHGSCLDTSSTRAQPPTTTTENDHSSLAEGRESSDIRGRHSPPLTRADWSARRRGGRSVWVRESTSTNRRATRGRRRSYSHSRTSKSNSVYEGRSRRRRRKIHSISTAESDTCEIAPSATPTRRRPVGGETRFSSGPRAPLPAQRHRGLRTNRTPLYNMPLSNGSRRQPNNRNSNDASPFSVPTMPFQEAYSVLDESLTKVLDRLPALINDFHRETKPLDYLEPKTLDEIWKQKVQRLKRSVRQNKRTNHNENGSNERNSNDGSSGGGDGNDGYGQGQDGGGGSQEGNNKANRGTRRNAGGFSIHELRADLSKLAGSINDAQAAASPPSSGRALLSSSAADFLTPEEDADLERRQREEKRVADFRDRIAPSMWRIQDRLNDKAQAVLSNVDTADMLCRDCEALLDILRRDAEFWNKGAGDEGREQGRHAGGRDGGRRGQ